MDGPIDFGLVSKIFVRGHLKYFLHRHEPKRHWHAHLKSGVGAASGMTVARFAIAVLHPLTQSPLQYSLRAD